MQPVPRFLARINLKINNTFYASTKNPKPTIGIEPMTSSLPRKCSTTELRGHKKLNNLTKKVERETGLEPATLSLEGWRSSQLSYSRKFNQPQNPRWGGEDSNLRRLSRQIYSLFPLATREPPRNFGKTQLSKAGQTPNLNLQRRAQSPF